MRGALTALGFAACLGATNAYAQDAATVPDPWEGFNRNMFAVHEGVDQAVLEPVARGYRAITPQPVRNSVRNFLRNLRGPVIFTNDVLQAEGERAGVTAVRFGINTTIGLLGIFDPATRMGFERHDEDFGQTLAVWGVDSGPYIFIPLLGPTTLRDGTGRVVDMAFDPLTWAEGDDVDTFRVTRTVASAISGREGVLDAVEDIRRDSLDPYVSIRNSYGTLRAGAIRNGRTDIEDLPDFDDTLDTPADATGETPDGGAAGDNPQQSEEIPPTASNAVLASSKSGTTSAAHKGETK